MNEQKQIEELVFEKNYWGDCCNTFDEEQKHYVYANLMQIPRVHYSFDAQSRTVLDIGGGPCSMLLKTFNLQKGKVVDPIPYPSWTVQRYNTKNIEVLVDFGENIEELNWGEVWIYNCLQHTIDPQKIIDNAKKAAKILRIFEWIDIPSHEGHPHELTEKNLNHWIGQKGNTIQLAENGCYGKAYYGCFNLTKAYIEC
jgi:hypothetical protein